ncbi:ribosome maturation factor RimM [Paenibacillus koleovorans]|uniref:ribosome maturation factor RimM n=1 Tax=Paenibacillus koleovorans TaxID=121608 RepID=UPI000FDAA3F8|nr:ribosome maturation factor RimM [Paenibacillus koleovorans]
MNKRWFNVGIVANTHGIRGELKIVPQTDFPEERFAKGSRLTLTDEGDRTTIPVEVESARVHKNVYIIKLKSYDNINDVEKYKGWRLKINEEQLSDLEEDEYYYHEIVGCRVVSDEGAELGTISEILSPGANHVWVVDRPNGKPLLLPVIDEVILNVDVQEKQVTVHLMEGLLG